jgi:Leucine-rich repeat (LRR) protein
LIKGELDFTRNTLLETLNVSYNRITSLEHLPESLEELYCDHNLLNVLSLKNTTNLRILHAKYNPKLVLQDLPDTLVERELPENIIQTNDKPRPVYKNYLDSVGKYFMMKDKYDAELLELKRKAKKAKRSLKHLPKCIGCGRNVGMIFSGKDQKYQAYCGNSSPCDWKIVIHRGDHYSFVETMEEMRSNLEETKENIICQKMDTLFQYISEEKSANLFKKQLSFFETNSEMAAKYYQQYLDLYFNSEKRDIIATKQKNIQELLVKIQEHLGEGQIDEVAKIQYEKIQPMAKYIQSLQYPVMSVDYFKKREEYRLDQREILLGDLEINHGEPVLVESVGKK